MSARQRSVYFYCIGILIFYKSAFATDQHEEWIGQKEQNSGPSKISKIICEDESGTITCNDSRYIEVITANYGRTDANTCYRIAASSKTDCFSAVEVENKIKSACNQTKSCNLNANNLEFGDPCKGTFKYLNVTYQCTVTTESTRASPTTISLWSEKFTSTESLSTASASMESSHGVAATSQTTPNIKDTNHKEATSDNFALWAAVIAITILFLLGLAVLVAYIVHRNQRKQNTNMLISNKSHEETNADHKEVVENVLYSSRDAVSTETDNRSVVIRDHKNQESERQIVENELYDKWDQTNEIQLEGD